MNINYKLHKPRIKNKKIDKKTIIKNLLKRDVMLIILLVITLVFVSSPSSFAHLQVSDEKELEEVTTSNMEGLLLTNTSINITDLIPSTENDVNNSLVNNCKDSSGETICSLYDFSVTNNENSTKEISFSLVGNYNESTYSYDSIVNTFSNIKFKVFKGEKTSINSSSTSIMTSDILKPNVKTVDLPELNTTIEKGQTLTYTIMFWIEKTSDNQAMLDASKTFDANVLANFTEKGIYNSYTEPLLNGNYPDLSNGLIPIVYNENEKVWQVANLLNAWYKYEDQRWANAASLDNRSNYVNDDGTYKYNTKISDNDILAMFVWIPRFSYTIGCISSSCLGYQIEGASTLSTATPGAIDIKFVDKNSKETFIGNVPTYTYTDNNNRNPSNYYTHPAFDFGGTPLLGIWVGKFETSLKTSSVCYSDVDGNCEIGKNDLRIIPNNIAFRYENALNQFNFSKYITSEMFYNLSGDSHMMKNSEWGAVAYLSQSIYGKYGNKEYSGANKEIYKNNSSSYYTGRSSGEPSIDGSLDVGTYKYNDLKVEDNSYLKNSGTGASTTGNIYGVYDMSGGAYERIMGNYNNTTLQSGFSASWFTSNTKYYDKFTNSTPFTSSVSQFVGHGFIETSAWYSDHTSSFNTTGNAWVRRGGISTHKANAGIYSGVFGNGGSNNSNTFRITLTK